MRRETKYAGNKQHLQLLKRSLARGSCRLWNNWRKEHARVVPDLRGVILAGQWLVRYNFTRARLGRAILDGANLGSARLEGASLRGASLLHANLEAIRARGADFSGANLRHANLHVGDFRRAVFRRDAYLDHVDASNADFTHAKLAGVILTNADLTFARFDKADLTRADVQGAILNRTSLLGANLRRATVGEAFIRNVKTDRRTDQRDLTVDVHVVLDRPRGDVVVFDNADDLRLAQFHDVVSETGAVASLIAASVKRVVLILGRFLPKRKRVLDELADALSARGKIPVIFDFPNPEEREVSDTVRFIAGMSQFIVVDLTKASSVPLELQATIPDLMVPVLPIVQDGESVFSMFSDLQRRYRWIQPTVSYSSADQLVRYVDKAIIERAERAAEEIADIRRTSVRPPTRVDRLRIVP
ncbi:MAG TPA: pentapeptide repeat-containing protein [Vicinamibacterales bacterium]